MQNFVIQVFCKSQERGAIFVVGLKTNIALCPCDKLYLTLPRSSS